MRPKLLATYAALFVFFALGGASESAVQHSTTFTAAVRQSLLTLIADLQKPIDRQAPTDLGASIPRGPINPALKLLGQPKEVSFSAPVTAQGLLILDARVIHEQGFSEWQLGTSDTGIILTYTFQISLLDHPTVTTRGLQPDTAGVSPPPPTIDPRVVEFLFASTRQKFDGPQSENVSYSGERGPLTFGAASVRIPDDHQIGHIELPSSWSLFGITLSTAPNEHEHFIIKRVVSLPEGEFGQIIKSKGAKTALVFVHGFNTTFEDALYRNAQIVWDLQYTGLSVLFTWASRGDLRDYLYDKESAYLARDAFIELLQKLKRDYGIEQINVLAHSMGNLVALDALANDAQTSDPVQIARLMMAAPDVDRDQFKALAAKAKTIVGGMTLYASSADRAMEISRRLAGGIPRAGDVPADGPIVMPNLDTIDVTEEGRDLLGLNHNVFAASRDVMQDISALLNFSTQSPRLATIHAVPQPPALERYWKFIP